MVSLLCRTAYLTRVADQFLALPNREVPTYLSQVLRKPWLGPDSFKRAQAYQDRVVEALRTLDVPALVENLDALIHLLPHQRFLRLTPRACNPVLDRGGIGIRIWRSQNCRGLPTGFSAGTMCLG